MPTYRKNPVESEAVQFTGENWAEMHAFTGHRETPDGHPIDIFNEIGTYLSPTSSSNKDAVAELWVEANKTWLPISLNEWVIQDQLGFYPCKDEVFKKIYTEVDDAPSTFLTIEPTIPGFYYNEGSAQVMIYLLDHNHQWRAIIDNGVVEKCVWEYIEQTIETYPLKRLS